MGTLLPLSYVQTVFTVGTPWMVFDYGLTLKHNSTGLHPPNLDSYKLTEQNEKWYHLAIHPLHTSDQNVLRASSPRPFWAYPWSMAFQVTISQDGNSLNTLRASSMLPHVAYVSTSLLLTKKSESFPLSTICLWAGLPSSSATMLAHTHWAPAQK